MPTMGRQPPPQNTTTATGPARLVPLGASGWHLWRDVLLRGAGFPARLVTELADPALPRTADALLGGTASADAYRAAFDKAVAHLSGVIRRTAADSRFREAVAWQNQALVATCLDKAARGEPRNRRGRGHEETIVSHLQRYALKNDTIGFFGPVGWAVWTEPDAADAAERGGGRLQETPGPRFLRRREVYFESWAIDTLAEALARDPAMTRWLFPCRDPALLVADGLARRPWSSPLPLTPQQATLLTACDGNRPAAELACELTGAGRPYRTESDLVTELTGLRDAGLITFGLEGPVEMRPETTLREKLTGIGDPAVRERALAAMDGLLDARADVGRAAGAPDALVAALGALNAEFERVTDQPAVRLHGQTYAGRTVVFEETVRDVRVELGTALRDELAAPLGLVLDSARWLANRIAAEYAAYFMRLHHDWTARNPEADLPLAELLELAGPRLAYMGPLPAPVRTAVQDFQRLWRRVLGEAARHEAGEPVQLASQQITDPVRKAFPATRPAISTAVHHAPDVMIAAPSQEAVRRGDYLAVLGELHVAFNSLENRTAVEHHPAPEQLRARDTADHGGRRVYMVPPKTDWWISISNRLTPPTAMPAHDTVYWSTRNPCMYPPGRFLALADLFVHPGKGPETLEVRDGAGTFRAPLLEVLSEPLAGVIINSFRPLPAVRHRGRITVDRLVVARETWTLPVAELTWATLRNEPERFLAARSWRADNALPDRLFAKTPGETKPVFLDLTSIPLVNLFARAARRTLQDSPEATITLTEVLPDTDQTWLTDHAGERYASELRIIAVDPLLGREG
ncbi:lantibiotic dehydratase [Streptomyces rimosus]|uniref:lantibiotic dehydratase n=1 Tax=Streptomyces rimosus TaxID=1927 RepID=UPI0004C80D62|nr:lantibiotic dehydratase [Streptomyces rimosus]